MLILSARPHRLLPIVIDRIGRMSARGKPCMLLVPAQYTLQAEIEVMTRLNLPGTFTIDVLSPGRLQSRVFERAGFPERTIFDERGKRMVLTQIAQELADDLTVYRSAAKSGAPGFIGRMSALIADIKRSGLTAEELRERLADMDADSPAARKLADALLIFSAYEQRMAGQLADSEDVSAQMRARLPDSGVLDGQNVFIYGFDMITPGFALDMLHMSACCESLTLAIETDENTAPDGRLFAPVNFSIDRLIATARSMGVPIERVKIHAALSAHDDLAKLERGLYAVGASPYAGKPRHIRLRASSGKRQEVHIVASSIRRLLAQGVPGGDIAIVYPKGSGYAPLLANILPQYGVAVYTAEKRAASAHPLARLLLCALAVIAGGFRAGDICDCLRTGFWPLETDALDALCAYLEGTDAQGGSLKKPFAYIKEGAQDDLDALNHSREIVLALLDRFAKSLRNAHSADAVVTAILEFLGVLDAFDTLCRMRETLKDAGLFDEAEDCAQVWNALMETLDQLHTLLGSAAIPARAVLELLTSGLSALELSALPPADGAVICGEIGNVRTAQVGTLFAIGMNDAPGAAGESLLTPAERAQASGATGAYLGMSDEESAALAQLDELKALSGALERVLVSYALSSETGGALREGAAVAALRRLFPDMPVRGGATESEQAAMLIAPGAALEALSVRLSEAADGKAELGAPFRSVYAALNRDESTRESLLAVTRRLGDPPARAIDGRQAKALYGRPVMSVSRLETFAQCPYKHFVAYGLAPQRALEPGVDFAELGTLYHAAADAFTRAASAEPGFPDLAPDVCDRLMDEAVAPLVDAWRTSPLGASKRGASLARRIRRKAKLAGRSILAQFSGSAFRPLQTELVFGKNGVAPFTLELADGSRVYLQGRIDRIDVMQDGHIRVIDYKSGAAKFDPTMVYYGLQLQLLLYLAAALETMPGARASGFFYCRIADPTIKTESRIKEEVERQIAKKLALSGISLSDVEILRAQGERHAAMMTKDGKPSASYKGQMADEDALSAMVAFARRKAAQLAGGAFAGDIEDSPAAYNAYSACAQCDFSAICGFDPMVKPRRRLRRRQREELR